MRDARGDGLVGRLAQRVDARLRFPAQCCLADAGLACRIAQHAEPGFSSLKLPRLLQQRMTCRKDGKEQQELQDMAADEAQQGSE